MCGRLGRIIDESESIVFFEYYIENLIHRLAFCQLVNQFVEPAYLLHQRIGYFLNADATDNSFNLIGIWIDLRGFWEVTGDFKGGGAAITDKSKFVWTMLIRQPNFVTTEIVEAAKTALAKKKPSLDLTKARLEIITEGLCVQVMHIGSYDEEPDTITALDRYAGDNGYALDMGDARRHHEIYLSDPRKVSPEKLKTVIRHPVRKDK